MQEKFKQELEEMKTAKDSFESQLKNLQEKYNTEKEAYEK